MNCGYGTYPKIQIIQILIYLTNRMFLLPETLPHTNLTTQEHAFKFLPHWKYHSPIPLQLFCFKSTYKIQKKKQAACLVEKYLLNMVISDQQHLVLINSAFLPHTYKDSEPA